MASTATSKPNQSEGQKRGLPSDMILDKDNCDYISQMLREKRQAEEQGKQSRSKNSAIPKTAVPPFMKGLHQMQQMQLQLAQQQQQMQSQFQSSTQSQMTKQTSLTSAQIAGVQTPSASSVSSENSTQASQSQQSDTSNLSINSKISSEQQKASINNNSQISQAGTATSHNTNSNNQNKQNANKKPSAQQKQNNFPSNQSKIGQAVVSHKNSNEQPSNIGNTIGSIQQESSSGNVRQQDSTSKNTPQENKLAQKQDKQEERQRQELFQSASPVLGQQIQIQEDKATQRKTIHNQQPKLFDQFFRNGSNSNSNNYDQQKQPQESRKIQQESTTSYNALTSRNSNGGSSTKDEKKLKENDHHHNSNPTPKSNNNDKQLDLSISKPEFQPSSSQSSSSSWQFPSTARKYDSQQQQQQQQCEQFEESLESSIVEIHHGLGPGSNMGNVSPTAQFNSLDSSSFNISNISNIQHVSNNNLSSINNHSNIAMSNYYPHQQQQNLSMSFHEHMQDQSPSQTGCYEDEPNNRFGSHRRHPSTSQKNNLQFLHALDSYIDYFESTSSTFNNKNSNANLRSYLQQQQTPPPFQMNNQQQQYHHSNNAFLLSQLEQLSQKYKESETSRGILIGDLSKAKNRYFQIKKQMQELVVRISELENALSLSNNRLLYTKEQLARENVELENAKFTLRQVLLNERNASSQTHGEDQFTQQQLSYYPKEFEQISTQNWNARRSTLPHQAMQHIDDISNFVSIPDHLNGRPLKSNKQYEYQKGVAQQQLQQQQYQLPIYQSKYQQQLQQPQRFSNRSSINVSPDGNCSKIMSTSNIYENGEKGLKLKQQQKQRILQQVQERDQLGVADSGADNDDGDQQQQQQDEVDNFIDYSTISHRYKPKQPYQQFQFNQEQQQHHFDSDSNNNQENLDNLNLRSHDQITYDMGLKLSSFHTQQPQHSRNTSRTFNTHQKETNKNKNISKTNQQQENQAQVSQGIMSTTAAATTSHKKTISLDEEHLYQMMRLKHFEGQLGGNKNSKYPYDVKVQDPISIDAEQLAARGQDLPDSNSYSANISQNFQNIVYGTTNQINSHAAKSNKNTTGRTMSLSYSKPATLQQQGLNQQFYKNQNQLNNQPQQMQYFNREEIMK